MRRVSECSEPIASGHPHWITVQSIRTVLVVVHTITAWNRLADILPVFDSDRRIQIVFTFPDASNVSGDVERQILDEGGVLLPWSRALTENYDLAISVHHSGELHCLSAPFAVLSHGMGYTKHARRETRDARRETRDARRETRDTRHETVYGLSREWLVRGGVVPDAIILSHEQELSRLAEAVPEALAQAVVAGDPCLDRMRASIDFRREYRRALGAEPHHTVVTVSTTWGPKSLLGRHPDLIAGLLGELTLDDHVVAAIVHPNAWFAHGPWQMRNWLADASRSGLRLIPPVAGWQQTVLASSVVVGDHGAVTAYAAAMGIPTLLASFPHEEIARGSAVDALGRTAPRLDPSRPLPEQIFAALTTTDGRGLMTVTDLASSRPDQCAQQLRATFYRLLRLPEPSHPAPVFPYPATDLRPDTQTVRACWLTCSAEQGAGGSTTRVHRWPADVTVAPGRGPHAAAAYLAVDSTHPRRDVRGNADIVIVSGLHDGDLDVRLAEILLQRPACTLAAAAVADDRILMHHRRFGVIEAALSEPVNAPLSASIIAAAVHDGLLGAYPLDPEPYERIILVGPQRITVTIARPDHSPPG